MLASVRFLFRKWKGVGPDELTGFASYSFFVRNMLHYIPDLNFSVVRVHAVRSGGSAHC